MIARFSRTGVKAVRANTSKELRIPVARAASEMKKMYGNISRLRLTVRSNFSGSSPKPQASIRTTQGEKSTPRATMAARIAVRT